jgi:hypothetical protein
MLRLRHDRTVFRIADATERSAWSFLLWFTTAARAHAVPFCWQPPQDRGRD